MWCLGMSELFPGHNAKQTATFVSSYCLSNGAQSNYQTTNELVFHDRDHLMN